MMQSKDCRALHEGSTPSLIPTAIIPTVSGTMWHSVDPLGKSISPDNYKMEYTSRPSQPNTSSTVTPARKEYGIDQCDLYPAINITPLPSKKQKTQNQEVQEACNPSAPVSDIAICNESPFVKTLVPNELISHKNIPAGNESPIHIVSEGSSIRSVSDSNTSSKTSSRIGRLAERVNKNRKCRLVLLSISLLCALNIFFLLFAYDTVVETVAASQLALHDSGVKYDAWTKSSVPVYYKVSIFNMTNPVDFMGGDRPRVFELGPYVYRMSEEKVDVKFHDNGTVSYRTKPLYFFEPELSSGSENDVVWTLDIPFINAADTIKNKHFLIKLGARTLGQAAHWKTLRKLTVKELLWGYKSNVLDIGRAFLTLPYPYPDFGLLVGMNNTAQQPYTMHTGVDDPHKMNAIYSWNGKTKLDFWEGDTCNTISGTDAGGFSPGVEPTDTLYIFNGQLCRSIPLVYKETVEQAGIKAYRFSPPLDIFNYGPKHPENTCYCTKGECPPQGVLDMKPCYFGASIAFSFPHFYGGHPSLTSMVRGLRPVPEKHNTEFDIFPDLGIPLRVKLRMQMNVVIDENQALNRARHFDLIYPIFWFEAGIDSLPPAIVQQLQMAQDLPPLMKTVCLAVTCFSTVVFLVLLFAHTVINLCTSTLSSLRSRSLRGSSEGTRSTTPDLDEQETRALDQTDAVVANAVQDSASEGKNSYTAYNTPQELDNEVRGRLVDNGTMLPPYREKSRAQQRQSFASDATDTLTRSEPDPIYNEYPPDYHAATVTQNNVSDGPLYQQHTHQVAAEVHTNSSRPAVIAAHNRSNNGYLSQMEHKSIVHPQPLASTNRTHDTLQTSSAHPVMSAPLASAEDFSFAGYGNSLLDSQKESLVAQQQEPLATSSPHLSQDDIEVQRSAPQNSGGGSPTYVNISQASDMTVVPEQNYSFRDHRDASFMKVEEPGVRGAVSPVERRHTLPSHSGYKKLHNASLPPPLESDL